jgi:uncharacterized lipoprotein YehR (DUF1307 family)
MMKSNKTLMSVLAIGILSVALSACQKNENAAENGAAEKAGKQLDQAAAQAAVQLNKIGEQAGKALEKAGEKIQGAAKDAQTKNAETKDAQK